MEEKRSPDLGTVHGLRRGFTTGACAQAASKAAAFMLRTSVPIEEVSITLPKGNAISLAPIDREIGNGWARCGVIKDAGDDDDVTNGIKVMSEVRLIAEPIIRVSGGTGVGTVTKAGLPVHQGRSAINPVPMKYILREVESIFPEKGIEVIISVPEGEAVAEKTWNPRLGILSGISILGTSGIVEPKSTPAFKTSIALIVKIAAEEGRKGLIVVPGYIGERYVRDVLKVPEEAFVTIGDHVGFSVSQCSLRGIRTCLFVAHVGKAAKVAAGVFDTHCKYADARLETIAAHAAACGAGSDLVESILSLSLAEASVGLLRSAGLEETFYRIARYAAQRLEGLTRGNCSVGCMVLSLDGELLGAFPRELDRRESWKRFLSWE